LMGCHRYDRVNVINVLRAALPLLIVVAAGLAIGGEQVIAAAQTLALVAVLVISFGLLRDLGANQGDSHNGAIADLLRYGSVAYIANLLHFAAMRGLLLFVSFYSGPEQVGYFNLALLLLEAMLLLPTSIGQLLFPQSSSPTLNQNLIEQLLRLNIYIGLIVATLTISFVEPLALMVLGDAYGAVGVALVHMGPAIVLMSIPRILSQILSGRGHPGYPMMAAVFSSVFGTAFAVWWIPTHGIVGAAWIINLVAAITAVVTLFGYCRVYGVRPMKIFTPKWSDFYFIRRLIKKG
jgi:O-antigen/teichoic acid export membrane protein